MPEKETENRPIAVSVSHGCKWLVCNISTRAKAIAEG